MKDLCRSFLLVSLAALGLAGTSGALPAQGKGGTQDGGNQGPLGSPKAACTWGSDTAYIVHIVNSKGGPWAKTLQAKVSVSPLNSRALSVLNDQDTVTLGTNQNAHFTFRFCGNGTGGAGSEFAQNSRGNPSAPPPGQPFSITVSLDPYGSKSFSGLTVTPQVSLGDMPPNPANVYEAKIPIPTPSDVIGVQAKVWGCEGSFPRPVIDDNSCSPLAGIFVKAKPADPLGDLRFYADASTNGTGPDGIANIYFEYLDKNTALQRPARADVFVSWKGATYHAAPNTIIKAAGNDVINIQVPATISDLPRKPPHHGGQTGGVPPIE